MARTRTAPATTADNTTDDNTTGFDFTAVNVTEAAELPKQRKGESKPNPLASVVKHSADNGFKPFQYGPVPSEMAKKAANLMHRAAREFGYGLSIRQIDNGDNTTTIVYQAKQEKKERKYSNADVRAWVAEQMANGETFDNYDANKRIPADVLRRYRDAHGIK